MDIQNFCETSRRLNGPNYGPTGPDCLEDVEMPVVIEEEEEQHEYYKDYVQNEYDYNDYEPKETLLEAAPEDEESRSDQNNYEDISYRHFGMK